MNRKIMNRKNKAGFTLVELMVVAIIVAILAAVAIPLMSGNKKKAQATEAQAGCSTIKTMVRVMEAEGATAPTAIGGIKGLVSGDFEGTYFTYGDYAYAGTGYSNSVITVTSSKASVSPVGSTLIMSNVNNVVTWGGTMLQ